MIDTAEMPPAAAAETVETMAVQEAEVAATSFAAPAEAEAAEAVHPETAAVETLAAETLAVETAPTAALVEAEAALAPVETLELTEITDTAVTVEAADAHDEAILDIIAMEMGAPDPIDDNEIAAAIAEPAPFAEPAPVEEVIVIEVPEPWKRPNRSRPRLRWHHSPSRLPRPPSRCRSARAFSHVAC